MNKYGLTNADLMRIEQAELNGGWLDEYESFTDDYCVTCEKVVEMAGAYVSSVDMLIAQEILYQEDGEWMLDGEPIVISDWYNQEVVY